MLLARFHSSRAAERARKLSDAAFEIVRARRSDIDKKENKQGSCLAESRLRRRWPARLPKVFPPGPCVACGAGPARLRPGSQVEKARAVAAAGLSHRRR